MARRTPDHKPIGGTIAIRDFNSNRARTNDRNAAIGMTTLTGIVTELGSNGFGFISPDHGGGDLWFRQSGHTASPAQPLSGSDAVEFDLRFGRFCPEAVNVRPLARDV